MKKRESAYLMMVQEAGKRRSFECYPTAAEDRGSPEHRRKFESPAIAQNRNMPF